MGMGTSAGPIQPTTPAQGGKGGGRPMPTQVFPGTPGAYSEQAQLMNQGKGRGIPMGGLMGGGGKPMPTSPFNRPGPMPAQDRIQNGRIMPMPPGGGYPAMQPQPGQPLTPGPNTAPPGQQVIGFRSPRQGETMSDYNIYGPANPPSNTGQVPAQGGKGRDFGPNVFPGPQMGQPIPGMYPGMGYPAPQPQVQQPGLMTQGQMLTSPGQSQADAYKAYLNNAQQNPEYQAYLENLKSSAGSGLSPVYQPLVQQLAPGQVAPAPTSRQAYDTMLASAQFSRPGDIPSYEQFVQQRTAPQMPQVMPQKPMPANTAPQQGLAGLQNMLYGGMR